MRALRSVVDFIVAVGSPAFPLGSQRFQEMVNTQHEQHSALGMRRRFYTVFPPSCTYTYIALHSSSAFDLPAVGGSSNRNLHSALCTLQVVGCSLQQTLFEEEGILKRVVRYPIPISRSLILFEASSLPPLCADIYTLYCAVEVYLLFLLLSRTTLISTRFSTVSR